MNVAPRMARLGTESAFEVLARARQLERTGREIIHLEIGEPDFDTPAHIKEAAKQALDAGATHYGPAAGLPELREAIAKHVAETRGIAVAPEEVVVTPGAKPIMFFTIMAMIGEGDEVIHPNPGFPIYESVINFVGGVPVPIPLREDSGFGFDLDLFERRVSPQDEADRDQLAGEPDRRRARPGAAGAHRRDRVRARHPGADRRDLPAVPLRGRVRLDHEPARHAGPDDSARRLLEIVRDDRLASRLRRDAAALAEHVARLMVNSNSCTASFVQLAGIAALQGDQTPVAVMVAEFKRRRDLLVDGLNRLPGVKCARPRGAFYVFPNITGTGRPSAEVAERLLTEAGVAALSGAAFGAHGEGYLRFSYANSEANLRKALDRMRPVFEGFAAR